MSDELENKVSQEPAKEGDPKESAVPYERFKEVNDKFRTLEKQLAQIQAERDAEAEKKLAEQQKYEELANKYKAELETERLGRLRLEAVSKAGLPANMAARLQGGTLEELAQDAAALAEFMKPATPGVPPAGSRTPAPVVTDAQLRDPEWVRKNMARILEENRAA